MPRSEPVLTCGGAKGLRGAAESIRAAAAGREGGSERPEQRALREQLSACVRLGTMSRSFAGWRGSVYADDAEVKVLADAGLVA